MKQIKTIEPVKAFGVTGFKVTFSILDLYKMQQLAFELETRNQGVKNELSEMIHKLFDATIGETNENWDFLREESAE
jgi:hypothetical protein